MINVPPRISDISVEEIGLSSRSFNGLARAGAQTLGDLFTNFNSVEDLMRIRNIGITSVNEIIEKVQVYCPEYTVDEINVIPAEEDSFISKVQSLIEAVKLASTEDASSKIVLADLEQLVTDASQFHSTKNELRDAKRTILNLKGSIDEQRKQINKQQSIIESQKKLIEKYKSAATETASTETEQLSEKSGKRGLISRLKHH